MNANRQIINAIANIQDELSRISTVAGLLDFELDGSLDDFQKKIVTEFNVKLRGIKLKNRALQEENRKLKGKIQRLEAQVKGEKAPEDAYRRSVTMAPPKNFIEEKVVILSSPIKGSGCTPDLSPIQLAGQKLRQSVSEKETLLHTSEVTSSQFNGLPTQYSDSSSQNHGLGVVVDKRKEREEFPEISLPKKRARKRNLVIGSFVGDETEGAPVVADSQDEFEPLPGSSPDKSSIPQKPPHYTALQRVEFLRAYFQTKKKEVKYKIDLRKNPISEKAWALDDFVPNPNWKPTARMNPNLGAMTREQEKSYRDFFNEAGLGKKMAGPVWDSEQDQKSEEEVTWDRSQVMDKYLSPPGYMTGDFVSTQEALEQKRRAKLKEQDRIKRRFASVLAHGEFMFFEETLNFFVHQKRYVNAQPIFSKV